MTVKELKKLLEQFDDDLIVEVNDCGEYNIAEEVYEDEETYCTASNYAEFLKNRTEIVWLTRKVVRIC